MKRKDKVVAAICAGATLLIWGVTFANTRALLLDFSPIEILLVRFALAWAVLAVAAPRGTLGWRGRDETLFAAMGLTGVFVYQLLENCAIYYTNASNVAILVSFGPIVTAVLARLFAKDRSLSPRVVLGGLVASCGVALVSLNGILNFDMRPLGDLMAFGAMVSWGVYSILVGAANARGVPPAVAIRKSFAWALVLMLPLAAWGATDFGYYALDGSFSVTLDGAANVARLGRPLNVFNLAFLGVLASAFAFVLWSKACAALGVVKTTVCLYLIPVIGVTFAALFLGERLTAMGAAGGVVIILGVALANWRRT